MRKILEERLENAINDYDFISTGKMKHKLQGQIEAYQDCLNLLPQPRTENELIKEFENLGYEIYKNDEIDLVLGVNGIWYIHIWKSEKTYRIIHFITIQEHKLLNELFECWGCL